MAIYTRSHIEDEIPEIQIFEWPSRFLVESRTRHRAYAEIWPNCIDFDPYCPYFVDLDELKMGWCNCRDFEMNVEPYLNLVNENHRSECKHIKWARKFRDSFSKKPTQLPDRILL